MRMDSQRVRIILIQLGSPRSPSVAHVRAYLKDFLGDHKVVDLSRWFWLPILYCFILTFRPRKSAEKYARIWDGHQFPLVKWSELFVKKVSSFITQKKISVEMVYLLESDSLANTLNVRQSDDRYIFIPMFPQYSESTSGSTFLRISNILNRLVNVPHFTFVSSFHRLKSFINLSANLIDSTIQKHQLKGEQIDLLVLSFHGIPERRVTMKGDLYLQHCHETFALIVSQLKSIPPNKVVISFQSRLGKEKWLGPYTDDLVKEAIENGQKNIAVYSPSFVVDCLETQDELGHELMEDVNKWGGRLLSIPCLNDQTEWCREFAQYIELVASGSNALVESLFYNQEFIEELHESGTFKRI